MRLTQWDASTWIKDPSPSLETLGDVSDNHRRVSFRVVYPWAEGRVLSHGGPVSRDWQAVCETEGWLHPLGVGTRTPRCTAAVDNLMPKTWLSESMWNFVSCFLYCFPVPGATNTKHGGTAMLKDSGN
jgi:hypothetical protein